MKGYPKQETIGKEIGEILVAEPFRIWINWPIMGGSGIKQYTLPADSEIEGAQNCGAPWSATYRVMGSITDPWDYWNSVKRIMQECGFRYVSHEDHKVGDFFRHQESGSRVFVLLPGEVEGFCIEV